MITSRCVHSKVLFWDHAACSLFFDLWPHALRHKVPKRGGEQLLKKFCPSTHVVVCLSVLLDFVCGLVTNCIDGKVMWIRMSPWVVGSVTMNGGRTIKSSRRQNISRSIMMSNTSVTKLVASVESFGIFHALSNLFCDLGYLVANMGKSGLKIANSRPTCVLIHIRICSILRGIFTF